MESNKAVFAHGAQTVFNKHPESRARMCSAACVTDYAPLTRGYSNLVASRQYKRLESFVKVEVETVGEFSSGHQVADTIIEADIHAGLYLYSIAYAGIG